MNSLRKITTLADNNGNNHSSSGSNTKGIMARISRVLFPDSPPRNFSSRIRFHAIGGGDSLANLCNPSNPNSPQRKNPSRKPVNRKGRRRKRDKHPRSEEPDERTIRSKTKSLDRARNDAESNGKCRKTIPSTRRSRSMESSILMNLNKLQNNDAGNITEKRKNKLINKKATTYKKKRKSRDRAKSQDKENIKPLIEEAKNSAVGRSRRSSGILTYSVFETLPTGDKVNISSVVSPLTPVGHDVHDYCPTASDEDPREGYINDSCECILSALTAPKTSKRVDLKPTLQIHKNPDLPSPAKTNEVRSEGKRKQNLESSFTSPSVARKPAKRFDNRATPSYEDLSTGLSVPPPPTRDNDMIRRMVAPRLLQIASVEDESQNPTKSNGISPKSRTACTHVNDVPSSLEAVNTEDATVKHREQPRSDNDILMDDSVRTNKEAIFPSKSRIANTRRRSSRQSRSVNRFIATFRRKRKRKQPRANKKEPSSCERSLVENFTVVGHVGEDKALRRSARSRQPTQRFTTSFMRRKSHKEQYKNVFSTRDKARGEKSGREMKNEDKYLTERNGENEIIRQSDEGFIDDVFDELPPKQTFKSVENRSTIQKSDEQSKRKQYRHNISKRKGGIGNDHKASVNQGRPSISPANTSFAMEAIMVCVAEGSMWGYSELDCLKRAHANANPMSSSFWQDVESSVREKSAEECRDKWFSMVGTPNQKNTARSTKCDDTNSDGEDDIFNSTPIRNENAEQNSSHSSTKSTKIKHKRRLSDIFSSPILINKRKEERERADNDKDYEFSPLLFRPQYKSYLKEVRNGIKNKVVALKSKNTNVTQQKRSLSASIDQGGLQLGGALSPGGTLHIEAPSEDEFEDDDFIE
jgi:hypothetical protein